MCFADNREIALESRVFYNGSILLYIIIYRLSNGFQHFRIETKTPSRKHTVPIFQMKVIAAMIRFLAIGIDIAAEMYFVRSLIRRKTSIAINTVSAVLGFYTSDTIIKQRDSGDNSCQ